ncbi:alpha/beta hydrolase [Chryseobacterium angstadtii]|uniref:Alpha/beta hydrolase n=1 Tax=Chryseobacterium angstadtii TaxID=558151 RepID=A0A0J7KSZ8_9FLAO|nr:alpha/beta hydrolase [Chryseobacterium angstadtii]
MAFVNHQTAPTKFIRVKGINFAYRILGKEKGIPLILLQGLGWSMDNWDPAVINGLAKKYRLIIFDNKGVASSGGTTPHTIQEMADDAIDFIQALNLDKVNIMGYSMGGFVAQRIAFTRPSMIHKLILVGSGPQGAVGLSDLPHTISKIKGSTPEEFFIKFGFTTSEKSIAAAKQSYTRIHLRTANRDLPLSSAAVASQFAAISSWAMPDASALTELNTIKCPVLIVHGENDLALPVQNAKIHHSELLIFPDSGHAAFFQNEILFVNKVSAFLSQ